MLCTTSECTASDIVRILAYSELCLFRYMQNYSSLLNIIKAYSYILKHFLGIFMLTQAYPAPYVTLAYSTACQILSPGIFGAGVVSKALWNFDKAYSELCHKQNPSINVYGYIFRKNTVIFTEMGSEPWHMDSSLIFRTLTYLKLNTYSETLQRFKIECFVKIIFDRVLNSPITQ